MNSLAKRSAFAALWNYAGNAIRLLLQFSIGILLARLLGPQAFGLIAIALLLIGFGQIFADFGFSAAIIQAHELRQGALNFLFTTQLSISIALTVLTFFLAVPIAGFFNSPEAISVIQCLAPMFVLRAFGQTSIALQRRELCFREIQIGTIASYAIGYLVIGLPMAFTGYGVWSLVAAQLVQTAISSLVAIIQTGYIPRPTLRGAHFDLFRFGQAVTLANISSWAIGNADSLIVGRMADTTQLGFYNRAMNLAGMPMSAIVTGLQGVLFSATSRAQNNAADIKKAVLACITLYLLLSGSVLFAVAATAETVILALYGLQWMGTVELLSPLAVAMVVHGVLAFLGPALMGLGRAEKEAIVQWQLVTLMLPLAVGAAHFSIVAVAWSIVIVQLLRLLLLARALNSIIRFDWREVVAALLPAFLISLFAAAAAALTDFLVVGFSIEWRLLLVIIFAGLGGLAGVAVFHRPLLSGPLSELILRSNILPQAIHQRLVSAR